MDLHLFISAFLFLSAFQGLFLSFVIFKNLDKHRHEKYFLIIMIVFFSLNLMANETIRLIFGSRSELRLSPFAFQLLIGPAFYHYCKSSVESGYKHKPGDMLKFLPFPVYVIFIVFARIFPSLTPLINPVSKVVWVFIIAELIYYAVVIRRMLAGYERNLDENLSDKRNYSLNWFYHLASALTVMIFIYFILHILNIHLLSDDMVMGIYSLIIAFFIYLFGYKGLTQKTLMYDASKARYAKSPLSKEYSLYWKEKLVKTLVTGKPYLDPELTLMKLADIVGTSDKIISQIINTGLNVTFYELINDYRIEEVKRILSSNKDINILESAFASGFNSKTAFNTIFKKKTGMTPSQFIKSLQK